MIPTFTDSSVLITGAGGSIGSQLCCKVAEDNAKRLTMVSLTEGGLYTIDKHLRHQYGRYRDTEFVPVMGSAGNENLMRHVLQGVDIVIHAAAHKHLPLCERNEVEAIDNNVFGTFALGQVAAWSGVSQFCLISSDKAVRPSSIMGATKRLAELLVAHLGRQSTTRFFTTRFGNVLDSAGSVLPLWREQVVAGEPITITDERCERYFMTIQSAVSTIARVIGMGPVGGVYVLDMGQPRRLIDMAKDLMREMGCERPIKVIGLRPGEKLTEELHHGGTLKPTDLPGVFAVVDSPAPVDLERLEELHVACRKADRKAAVPLLWELAC